MDEQCLCVSFGQWKVYLSQTESGNLLVCPYKPNENEQKCVDILVKPDLSINVNGFKIQDLTCERDG